MEAFSGDRIVEAYYLNIKQAIDSRKKIFTSEFSESENFSDLVVNWYKGISAGHQKSHPNMIFVFGEVAMLDLSKISSALEDLIQNEVFFVVSRTSMVDEGKIKVSAFLSEYEYPL